MFHQSIDPGRHHLQNTAHNRPNYQIAQHGQQHTENTGGKVINQHFEACRHMAVHGLVKFLNAKACQRADYHGCHQHRDRRIAHNRTDHRNGAYYPAAVAADHPAAGGGNKDRDQIGEHGAYHAVKAFVGNPPGINKQRGKKTKGDQRPYIWHNHCR